MSMCSILILIVIVAIALIVSIGASKRWLVDAKTAVIQNPNKENELIFLC